MKEREEGDERRRGRREGKGKWRKGRTRANGGGVE